MEQQSREDRLTPGARREGWRLLIVDDSRTMRRVVRRTLDLARLPVATVTEASDGAEAWEHLRAQPCDLVLTDLHMPRMSGTDLIARMREDPWLRGVPIVVMTSEAGAASLAALRACGVAGYIRKPSPPEKVRDVLLDVMGEAIDDADQGAA